MKHTRFTEERRASVGFARWNAVLDPSDLSTERTGADLSTESRDFLEPRDVVQVVLGHTASIEPCFAVEAGWPLLRN